MRQQVNFIAARAEAWREARWWGVAGPRLAGGLGLLTLALLWLVSSLASNRAEALQRLSEERQAVGAAAAQARLIRTELERVDGPRRLARAVRVNNAHWLDLLRELRDRLPEQAWLTAVEVTSVVPGEAASALRLEGQAGGHEAIGRLLTSLCQSPWIESARLIESSSDDAREEAPIDFAIEGRLRRPIPLLAENGG